MATLQFVRPALVPCSDHPVHTSSSLYRYFRTYGESILTPTIPGPIYNVINISTYMMTSSIEPRSWNRMNGLATDNIVLSGSLKRPSFWSITCWCHHVITASIIVWADAPYHILFYYIHLQTACVFLTAVKFWSFGSLLALAWLTSQHDHGCSPEGVCPCSGKVCTDANSTIYPSAQHITIHRFPCAQDILLSM